MNAPENSATKTVIEMQDVAIPSSRRPHEVSVGNVNWTVAAGDFWAVAAMQGCGKSDFVMTTGGLVSPMAGAYRLFGELMPILDEDRLDARLRLGLVFDDARLFNHLTIAENVGLPLQYHRNQTTEAVQAAVMEALDLTELLPWANNTPGTLAWSWQKRAALARALVLRPEILLLDNPLSGLDPQHSFWWLDFLSKASVGKAGIGTRPLTLVVTADDLNAWKWRAHQFALIKDARMKVLGTRKQLEESADELAKQFLAHPASNT